MRKYKFLLTILPLLFAATGCNPNFSDSSNEGGGGSGGSNTSSESGQTSNPPSEDESSTGDDHTHTFAGDWHYDTEKHWQECECGEKGNIANHNIVERVKVAPTLTTEGVMAHECSVCDYALQDTPIPCIEDEEALCDLVNTTIANLRAFDVFEIRDQLNEAHFDVSQEIYDTGKYFGYDYETGKAVLYTADDGVVYPSTAIGHHYMTFNETEANSLESLKEKISQIASGTANFSSIKLIADIELNYLSKTIFLNTMYPIEINLNSHTVSCGEGSTAFTSHVFEAFDNNTVAVIRNGTITTRTHVGFDLSTYLSCIFVANAKTFRATSLILNSNDERGYGICDRPDTPVTTKVKVNKTTINAKNIAFAIQGADYLIENNTINGVVDINGGVVDINKCTVSAKGVFGATHVDQEMHFIDNSYLAAVLNECFAGKAAIYNTMVLSSPDAILVIDRRSPSSTYSSPLVTVTESTLIPDYAGEISNPTPYGYGFRYIDLKNDPNKPTSSKANIALNDNEYPTCSSSDPSEENGGFSKYETA